MALFSVLSIENLRSLGDPPQDILTRSGHDAELHDLKNEHFGAS
jgi:hypothetical protein